MNRTFDFYEYAGFIIPGSVLCIGLLIFFPEARALFSKEGVTFGELGLFVIIAYAAGQLVQSIGNLVEWIVYLPMGGRQGERALAGKYLSSDVHKRLAEALKVDPKVARDIATCDAAEYRPTISAVYALVIAAGKGARIDAFNGNYGLMRGLAAAFVVLIFVAPFLMKSWSVIGVLALLLVLSVQRMNRYSGHYTKELITQYLLLPR